MFSARLADAQSAEAPAPKSGGENTGVAGDDSVLRDGGACRPFIAALPMPPLNVSNPRNAQAESAEIGFIGSLCEG
jgi:hypothetical protein